MAESQEAVAMELFRIVAAVDSLALGGPTGKKADRAYVLSTYATCLEVVKGHGDIEKLASGTRVGNG